MEVILQKDVDRLGKAFDLVKVRDGYALNYLLPLKLAVLAAEGRKKRIELDRKTYERKQAQIMQSAQDIAKKLEELSVTISVKVGEGEKMYGSVTAQAIADKLAKEGYEIAKKDIRIKEPIRSIGVYNVPVKVHVTITAELKVWVVKEGEEGATPAPAVVPAEELAKE
ncbi:MAG: 50S ribosomal protein L9 [Candidatus Raymondbacteria bacterium RifOxyC12_full_50_8]|nr:MAG: 50S ribosomal protein L9 [Candidatus Raymondbacteria bacterium RifOxyC12_full_50_8]